MRPRPTADLVVAFMGNIGRIVGLLRCSQLMENERVLGTIGSTVPKL